MEEDVTVTCPHCWETISIRIDLSAGGQSYVQDCEVCCNPLEIAFRVEYGRAVDVDVRPIGQ